MFTVLVVEDNPLHSKLFAEILRHHGYRVVPASDGPEGIAIARREPPDLMIVDCYLRSAHGIDVVGAIRAVVRQLSRQAPLPTRMTAWPSRSSNVSRTCPSRYLSAPSSRRSR